MILRMPCSSCDDPDPHRAFELFGKLVVVERLVDESHFSVKLRRCSGCGQAYAETFSERIDLRGNDPQDWLVVPLDAAEAQAVYYADAVEAELSKLSPRRFLLRWRGRGTTVPEARWKEGKIWPPPHD
jgi:hypothetical protein